MAEWIIIRGETSRLVARFNKTNLTLISDALNINKRLELIDGAYMTFLWGSETGSFALGEYLFSIIDNTDGTTVYSGTISIQDECTEEVQNG